MTQDSAAHSVSADMQACIEACTACHQTCLHNIHHCLEKGGKHAEPSHITLLLDCAQICATSADFMTRHSAQHTTTCRACAEVCRACAEDCEKMDDAMMRECAKACRRCAESCDRMATMG